MNLHEGGLLEQVFGFIAFHFLELFFAEFHLDCLLTSIALGFEAELEVGEFCLGHQLGVSDERIPVHLLILRKLVIEAILSVLVARLHSS